MSIPLLVVNIPPGTFVSNFQGTYSATTKYQIGQIVRSAPEQFWTALQVSTNHAPAEGSPYWGFLGNAEAVVTTALVEEEREAAEAAAEALAITLGAYSGKTERATGKEIEEDAGRRRLVTLSIESKTATRTLVEVQVNKVFAGQVGCSVTSVGKDELTISFAVAAGQKWEAVVVEGSVEKLYSSSVEF